MISGFFLPTHKVTFVSSEFGFMTLYICDVPTVQKLDVCEHTYCTANPLYEIDASILPANVQVNGFCLIFISRYRRSVNFF